ncbi:hypothetical protein KIL84_002892 [Mauremys mutica]|uniref:Uncharacterized protein n=1 Tax=Mauremys mutica TaxID=74926 RepID=A0A9D3WNL4_9SAUR|nr:hypothetical protein KIL84_002892 [Mauremys mutica]
MKDAEGNYMEKRLEHAILSGISTTLACDCKTVWRGCGQRKGRWSLGKCHTKMEPSEKAQRQFAKQVGCCSQPSEPTVREECAAGKDPVSHPFRKHTEANTGRYTALPPFKPSSTGGLVCFRVETHLPLKFIHIGLSLAV